MSAAYHKKSRECSRSSGKDHRTHHPKKSESTGPLVTSTVTEGNTTNNSDSGKVETIGCEPVDKFTIQLDYYHGLISREDVKELLTKPGDFLFRLTEPYPGQPRNVILSVNVGSSSSAETEGEISHYVITKTESGKYILNNGHYNNFPAIVTKLLQSKTYRIGKRDVPFLRVVKRKRWELSHKDVDTEKKIGEGAFGEVYLGKYTTSENLRLPVAIKLFKLNNLTKEQIKGINREARIMRSLRHPNIIKLYGVVAEDEPIMLVIELADSGSLKSWLEKHPDTPSHQRLEMCAQASFGVEYLHSKKLIHCDLAARNCLYGGGKVKISDFGMTNDAPEYKMPKGTKAPIKWLSPETIQQAIYTQKSDVYSFGVVAWEIITGAEPYSGVTNQEVLAKIREGVHLEFPDTTLTKVVRLIKSGCWPMNPEERYTMKDVASAFEDIANIERPEVKERSNNKTSSRQSRKNSKGRHSYMQKKVSEHESQRKKRKSHSAD